MARPELPLHEKEQPLTMPKSHRTQTPRSSRRPFLFCAILGTFLWTVYALHTGTLRLPFMATQSPSTSSPAVAQPVTPSTETASHRANLVKLQDLPHSYLPKIGSHKPKERLIVVGDVHGMLESLEELLAKLTFNKEHDHLILAGDMISKGPDSKGVVDLAIKLGATGIRGNHEDRVLAAYRRWRKFSDKEQDTSEQDDLEMDTEVETEDSVQAQSKDDLKAAGKRKKDRKLIKQLGRRRIKWLEQCPVILRVGKLGDMGEVVVVHAGLAPGVELKRQDPEEVMNMRTILPSGKITDGRDGVPWIKVWNKHQKTLPKHDRTTVIYGHDSHRGLRIKKYSMGVDTGCVAGGELTAVVIEGGHSKHIHKVVSVKCKNAL